MWSGLGWIKFAEMAGHNSIKLAIGNAAIVYVRFFLHIPIYT